jgi:hypothetical protein
MKYTCSLFSLLLLLAMPLAASAQSCTTAVCNAASASESDFLAALPSSGNSNATVVVNIPTGSASWTTPISYTVPSAVTNLTIQGNTSIVWTGTAGTSSYAYAVTDRSIIQDSYSSNNPILTITINGANTVFRMTGLTIEGGRVGSSSDGKYGIFQFSGNTQHFRLDNNHFNNLTYSPSTSGAMVRVYGSVVGVMDHNVLDLGANNSTTTNGFQAFDPADDTIGNGDGSWANPTGWGTSKFLFMENNFYNGGAPDDCADGARFVMRYNTINAAYVGVQSHGTKSPAGPTRGCRAYEVYHNYFTAPGNNPASGSIGSKGNSQLIWGNTTSYQAAYRFYESSTDRNSGAESETNTPNGWGYCGTSVNSNGAGSAWDGNQSGGYPCLDGLGRGQTQQALNGQNFPSRLNSSTGTISWPHQYLEPIYMWDNSVGSATYVQIQDSVTQNNRDYYYDCGQASGNASCSSGFTGAAGTGYGTLAKRPSTCTAGPGGTYFTSPTGSYGVAYFATDANGGNGELYVCTSTNTWTGIYQPYAYPHPLVSGGSVKAGNPDAPTNLTGVVK